MRLPAGTEKRRVATVTVVVFSLRRAVAGVATPTGATPRTDSRVVKATVPAHAAPATPRQVIGREAVAPRTDTLPTDADGGPAGTTTVTVAEAEAPARFVAW